MTYRVFQRKRVPMGRGLLHEGECAVCVILDDGEFTAWGFAPTWAAAECLAVSNAEAVRDNRTVNAEASAVPASWPFEMNGLHYETDAETLIVLREIVPGAKKTGDASAVAAVMALGLAAGRIREIHKTT